MEKGRVEGNKALFNLAVGYFCRYILIYLGQHSYHPPVPLAYNLALQIKAAMLINGSLTISRCAGNWGGG
jgi:hypothetical protein